jgi:hypothetical protein
MTKVNGGGLQRFTDAAVSVLGAAAGVGAGILTQSPAVGIAAGVAVQALVEIGTEVSHRVLSPKQEERIGTVLVLAAAAVEEYEAMGRPVRDDGFFDGDRSDADEIIEGVLYAAMTAHQERKLPYLANLLAYIACGDLDVDTANILVEEAERASWLELKVLVLFAEPESFPMPDRKPSRSQQIWSVWSAQKAFEAIGMEDKGYVSRTARKSDDALGMPFQDGNLSAIFLTPMGGLLVHSMKLQEIPAAELHKTHADLLTIPADA